MINFIKKFKTFIIYIFFGICTTCVNLMIFYFLKRSGMTSTDAGNTLANGISWAAAVVFAFVTNKIWVFKSRTASLRKVAAEAAEFVGARIFSGLFEIILPTPLSHAFGDGFLIRLGAKAFHLDGQWEAKLLVSVIVVLLNYLFSKMIVFRNKGDC